MAACGSLRHIFEKPLPENPTLLESLSPWSQIKPVQPLDQNSFAEIFGELHFKDTSHSPSSSSSSFPKSSFSSPPSSFTDLSPQTISANLQKSDSVDNRSENKTLPLFDTFTSTPKNEYTACHRNDDGFSLKNYESLQLCTEGLGIESSDDVEDMKNDIKGVWQYHEEKVSTPKHSASENTSGEFRKSKSGGEFPPPISCIGKSGKPWVCFKSYRHDGRFVLEEIRGPTLEFLHACRENGRLKLKYVHSNDEITDEAEEEEEGEEENYINDEERKESVAK